VKNDYVTVTEIAGDDVTKGQIDRQICRYYWAGQLCKGKDALEVACGTGPGLGYLSSCARTFEAGDFSEAILAIARRHYRERICLLRFNAQVMPYKSKSKDVIVIFEAIYYLPDAEQFISECVRVLRPGAKLSSIRYGRLLLRELNYKHYTFNTGSGPGTDRICRIDCSAQGIFFGHVKRQKTEVRDRRAEGQRGNEK